MKKGSKKKVKIAVISSAKDFFFKGMEVRLPRNLLAYQKEYNKLKAAKSRHFTPIKPQFHMHHTESQKISAIAA